MRVAVVVIAMVAVGCGEAGGGVLERRASALAWGGEQEIVAGDAAELDEFGWSVALTADSALVGAYGESDARGAVYAFARSGDAWSEAQKLVASDGVELDRFGWSVALAGDRALLGAYAQNGERGAAYVFVRSGDGANLWTEEQKLVASDAAAHDQFGWSVALAGDRALIGAYGRDAGRGAAYVFVRSGGGVNPWTEEQKLVASDGVEGDDFGYSVALAADQAGDRALVGAPARDNFRGIAHVFVRIDGAWAEEQRLVVSDGAAFDQLGNSVALAGNRALVGAYWKDDLSGAGYVFVRGGIASDPPWTVEQKLVASDRATGDRFGNAVSLTGDRALLGAFGCNYGTGGAYVFARNGSAWTEEQKLVASDGIAPDAFGWSVSLAADHALVGANYVDQLRGAAYLFSLGAANGDAGSADAGGEAGADGGPIEAGPSAPGSCTRGDDCTSGHCEDGICCDRTCSPSERCLSALKISGEDGTCGPATAAALGAACRFDVQCTSGHCAEGVCANALAVTDPAVDPGCTCGAGGSPPPVPVSCLALALALLLLRTRAGRPGRRLSWAIVIRSPLPARGERVRERGRSLIALALTLAGAVFGGCVSRNTIAPGTGLAGGGGASGTGGTMVESPLLPAGVRRLTNDEYAASVYVLLGVDAAASVAGFPRDATQKLGFTVNDAQIVSSVLAAELDRAAGTVVAAARESGQFDFLAPCSDPIGEGESCARAFIQSFGARAYRRPLVPEDVDPLLALYRAATAEGGSHNDGIDFVTRAILQSPSFIYLTELGDSSANTPAGQTTLTAYETASLLSYLVTAAPPDKELLDNVDSLATADGREQQLRRLLPTLPARARLVRLVREWLGIDAIAEIDKDSNVYPSFAVHHDAMAAESQSFINEVLRNGAGTLQELLGAEWTTIGTEDGATDEEAASYYTAYYGLGPGGTAGVRIPLTGAPGGARVGILNQGAFLSRFATATGSHPVLRGVAVMRRVACLDLPDPAELDINVVPPVPDPSTPKTTRALYDAHAADPNCRTCHQSIDSFGFAFEQYDGMGAFRANRQEAVRTTTGTVMLPIDTATTVAGTGTDLDGDYADSNALARALSTSAAVRACLARQMFRGSTGRGDSSARGAEDDFVSQWRLLSADKQSNLIETLVALVRSNVFVERSRGP